MNALGDRRGAPCQGQTADQVKDWLKNNVQIGATVVVRHTQGGFLQYVKATVVRIGRGRFEVDSIGRCSLSTAGKTFYYTGKNCWEPQGQTRLVIPTEAVLAAVGEMEPLGSGYAKTTV